MYNSLLKVAVEQFGADNGELTFGHEERQAVPRQQPIL